MSRCNGGPTAILVTTIALVALASGCSDGGSSPSQATFRGVGFLPDLANGVTRVFGMSRDGSTVVGVGVGEAGFVAFRWTAAGGIESLGVPPGKENSEALSANQDGSAIAGGVTGFMGTGPRGARWSEAEGWQVLEEEDGWTPIGARAITADGVTLAGTQQMQGEPIQQPFLWSAAGGFERLGRLDDAPSTTASGISGDGSVVCGFTEDFDGGHVAFRWTAPTGIVALEPLEVGENCIAQNVSADGKAIVGQCGPDNDPTAVLWDDRGGVTSLGTLPGGIGSLLWAVSGDGSVGAGEAGDSSGLVRAAIWNATEGMQDLLDVLVGLGLEDELDGWLLLDATAISNDGRTIAGTGIDPDGRAQGYVATLP